ncbi:SusC/RagA family TonB-linked outer membrane protein [Mucilaginibacter sp. UYCu711]|uniref:SusC/RagA family TonB-linked outer membrane protein n=1 Tax=Mucilaginibacter sp. UYCu711 TaxID=3156339 RepID=UPI003D1F4478
MKLNLLILALLCTINASLHAQQKTTGQVINMQTGEPVPGATIKLIKTGIATKSGSDGYFYLSDIIFPDSVVISHIGYNTKKQLLRNYTQISDLKITLQPVTTELHEVIVSTGYQTLPKERTTGSFTAISNHKLNEQVSTDILSRLEPITSGLVFNRTTGSTPQIQIRGLSTINGPTSPLIILDNFPYEGDIANINPNDVESITVLKDAAAASIWGTRAGNGVIVITSKKARLNQPLSIDFNANMTIGTKPDLSYTKPISSNDYINVEKMLFSNGFYDSKISDPAHPNLSPVVELLAAAQAGTISAANANSQIDAFRNIDVRNDFDKYFYQQSRNQQYAISLKGGSATESWLFSSGYDKNVSNLAAGYNRINLHFQNTFRPIPKLQVATSLFYTQSNTATGKPGYGDILSDGTSLYPYARFADGDGNALPIVKNYSLSYLSTAGDGKLLDWKYYPLNDYKEVSNKTNLQDVTANLSANYQLFSFLNFNLQYQYKRQDTHNNNLQGADSYYTRDRINSFTQIDPSGNVTYIIPKGGILNQSDQLIESHNLRGQFNVEKNWSKSEINAIAGVEVRQINTTGYSNGLYGYDPNTLTFGNVDLTNTYPDFVTGSYNFIQDNKNLTAIRNRFVSLFGNAAYTYDRKYTFSLSARRDASNLFGVNTNNKWNPLGSAGAAWEISKEHFYQVGFLPYLRLRATYGLSGNVDLSRTAVTTISYSGNSPYTQTPYAIYNTYANPNLKWETSKIFNLAVDFSTVNNRISGSIEYFRKNGENLFGNAPLDYTTGIGSTVTKNVASMKGSGADITLNTINTTGAFQWTTQINFSFYKDKITSYYTENTAGYNFVSAHPSISGVVGKPVYSILSYSSAGLDPANGNPRGYINGQLSEDYASLYNDTQLSELKYSGSALPTKYGSVSNTFSYKNVTLTVVATYKLGYYFKKTALSYSDLFQNGIGNGDYAIRWQKPGDELHTTVPSMSYPAIPERDGFYAGSEDLVEKGDHIRIQYISASYEFNRSRTPGFPFKVLQLYTTVSNLGVIWRANKDHIDPDYYFGPSTLKPPLTISLGLKASL